MGVSTVKGTPTMILTLIALLTAAALSIWAIKQDNVNVECTGMFFLILTLLGFMFYAAAVLTYIGAGYKADILNREYGTEYTQAELFHAGDVIDTVRMLQRTRVEVNGDLLKVHSEEK